MNGTETEFGRAKLPLCPDLRRRSSAALPGIMKFTSELLMLVMLTGCVTSVENPGNPPARQAQPPIPLERKTVVDKRIVIDPALQQLIRLVGVRSSEGTGGFLKIQVDVQNLGDSLRQFSYRIDWLDSTGQLLPQASVSMPWTLLPHETSFLAVTAPTPSARDFRVTFIAPGD